MSATRKPRSGRRPSASDAEQETRDGRRLEPVGLAMGTALVALAVAALLNANGMHKNASIQPDSPARDVALAVTGDIASVSGTLGLTEPRHAIAAAAGHGSKDDIVASLGAAPPKAAIKPTPTAPTKQIFSPSRKLRVYTGGDSLSIETANAIAATAPLTGVMTSAEPDGHLSTGLLRPDAFNWFERAREVEANFKPNVSILVFGGNDNDGYMTGQGGSSVDGTFGSASWRTEYGRRVGLIMDTLTARQGQLLLWVGAPVAQDSTLDAQMKVLNSVYSGEALKRKGRVEYVDPDPIFAPNGSYQTSVPYHGGQAMVREPDGQHLNFQGGIVLADHLLELIAQRVELKGGKAVKTQSNG